MTSRLWSVRGKPTCSLLGRRSRLQKTVYNPECRFPLRPTSKEVRFVFLGAFALGAFAPQQERGNSYSHVSGILITDIIKSMEVLRYCWLSNQREKKPKPTTNPNHPVILFYLNYWFYATSINFIFAVIFLALNEEHLSQNSKESFWAYIYVLFPSEFPAIMSLLTFNF